MATNKNASYSAPNKTTVFGPREKQWIKHQGKKSYEELTSMERLLFAACFPKSKR